jgi:hypothetical protein
VLAHWEEVVLVGARKRVHVAFLVLVTPLQDLAAATSAISAPSPSSQ